MNLCFAAGQFRHKRVERTVLVSVERGRIWEHGSRHRHQLRTPTGTIIKTMARNSQNEIGRLSPLTYMGLEEAEEMVFT